MLENDFETIIVMATYNGERFVAEQLDSIVNQTYEHWHLLIRDDGSTDGTLKIVERYAREDARIRLLPDDCKRLGAAASFSALMETAQAEHPKYLLFADQDDVWIPEKIDRLLTEMHKLEQRGEERPLLVYSDMEVVNARLGTVAHSFMHYQGIGHEYEQPLSVLLVQNFITGCALMLNKPLLNFAVPSAENVMMHDWWLALCAAAYGEIGFVDQRLVKYRLHGGNAVGAKSFWSMLCTNWIVFWRKGMANQHCTIRQAEQLLMRMESVQTAQEKSDLVRAYSNILDKSRLSRLTMLRKLGIHAQSRYRHLLLITRLLFLS